MNPLGTLLTPDLPTTSDAKWETAAVQLAQRLLKVNRSSYSHDNAVSGNHYYFNCYGFISHLLENAAPDSYRELCADMAARQDRVPPSFDGIPCPFNYFYFFRDLPALGCKNWKPITALQQLVEGDVIAYLPPTYNAKPANAYPARPTGTHLMLVETVHEQTAETCRFTIIDCTRKPHNTIDDSRSASGGIGRSTIILTIEGSTYFLQWEEGGRKLAKQLAFGRPSPGFTSLQLPRHAPS